MSWNTSSTYHFTSVEEFTEERWAQKYLETDDTIAQAIDKAVAEWRMGKEEQMGEPSVSSYR